MTFSPPGFAGGSGVKRGLEIRNPEYLHPDGAGGHILLDDPVPGTRDGARLLLFDKELEPQRPHVIGRQPLRKAGSDRSLLIYAIYDMVRMGPDSGVLAFVDAEVRDGGSSVTAILGTGDAVWLGSLRGLYRLADEALTPVLPQMIRSLRKIGDTLWVGTDSNAFRIIGDGDPVGVFVEDPRAVSDIVEARGAIWLTTPLGGMANGPCFRLSEGRLEAVGKGVISVAEIRGEVWLGTTRGAFRHRPDGELEGPVGRLDKTINTLAGFRQRVWLGTTLDGVFTSADGDVFEGLTKDVRLAVRGIYEVGDHVWLQTDTGAYRVDHDVDLVIRPQSTFSVPGLDLDVIMGGRVRIEAAYDRGGSDPYGNRLASRVRGIVRFSSQDIEAAHQADYQPVERLEEPAPTGFSEAHVRVRDSFGNVVTLEPPQALLVLPAASFTFAIGPLGSQGRSVADCATERFQASRTHSGLPATAPLYLQ